MDNNRDSGLSHTVPSGKEVERVETSPLHVESGIFLTENVGKPNDLPLIRKGSDEAGEGKCCKGLKGIIDDKDKIIEQLLAEAAKKEEDYQRLQQKLVIAEAKSSSLTRQNSQLKEENERLKRDSEIDKEKINQLLEDCNKSELKLRNALILVKQLKTFNFENEKYVAELHKRHAARAEQIKDMKESKRILEKEKVALASKVLFMADAVKFENAENAKVLDMADKKVTELNEKLSTKNEQIRRMNDTHKEMLETISDVLRHIHERCEPRSCWPFSIPSAALGKAFRAHIASLIDDVEGLLQTDISKQTCKLSLQELLIVSA